MRQKQQAGLAGLPAKAVAAVAFWLASLVLSGCHSAQTTSAPPPGLQLITVHEGEAASSERLTVGTYNVHWLTNPRGLHEAMSALPGVNAWCLQEARVAGDDASDAEAALEAVLPPGRWYVAVARANRMKEIGSGDWESQVIASRFPIAAMEVWPLHNPGAGRGPKRRLALAAQVESPDGPVWVVNTDHEPSYFAWRDRNRAQVGALSAHLSGFSAERIVLAGDFNCVGNFWQGCGNETHARRIDERLAPMGMGAVNSTGPTFEAGPLSLRLDRMFVRGLRVQRWGVAEAHGASDHFPVWCEVTPAPR